MKTLLVNLMIVSVIGCKAKSTSSEVVVPRAVEAASRAEKQDVYSRELNKLKVDIGTYVAENPDDVEFNQTLNKIAEAKPEQVESFVLSNGMTKAEEKADQVNKQLAEQATGADGKPVEGALKGAAVFTAVLCSLGAIGVVYSVAKDWKALSTAGKFTRLSRAGLGIGAATLASVILSQDKASNEEVIALGGVMGIIAMMHAESAVINIFGSKQQLHGAEIKFDIRKDLIKSKFQGDVFARTEEIYSEALLKKASANMPADTAPIVERAAFRIHDAKTNAEFVSSARWNGIWSVGLAVFGSTLAASATMGLAETPRAAMLDKIEKFWDRMKSMEPMVVTASNSDR